jgi:hypothetical protein
MSCAHDVPIIGCRACAVRASRRRFFFGLAAAGVALAAPPLPAFVGVTPACPTLDWTQVVVPMRYLMARVRISAELLERSRQPPSPNFLDVAAEELRAMALDMERREIAAWKALGR